MQNAKDLIISQNTINELESVLPRFMASQIGTQFRNHRDYYQVFGWERNITSRLCYALYKSHGIAKAVNDVPVNTTWRYYPQITSTNTTFQENITALNKRIKLLDSMKKADRLSGVGFYSIMVLNIKNQSYKTQLRSFQLRNLTSISVYSDWEVDVKYKLDSKTGVKTGVEYYIIGQYEVHPSRVIHIAEDSDNKLFGQSRIAPIYYNLYDM